VTSGLGNQRSIQLSYAGLHQNAIAAAGGDQVNCPDGDLLIFFFWTRTLT
jgi:hypothetical protein